MLQGMDDSEFGQFVAALWEQQGWQTQVKRDGGRVFVAAQRPDTGEEGLLWAVSGSGEVGGKQVQKFASLCQEYQVEEAAIVTAGTVDGHAEKVASGTGVELLDGEGIKQVVQRNELTHLVEQYGGGGAPADGGTESGSDGPLDQLPVDQLQAVAGRAGAVASKAAKNLGGGSLPVSPVVVVVVVVALVGAGVLFGPSVPFLGGGDGPVSAESVTPEQSATTLHVKWNATVTDSIDPNESDGRAYYPPEGEQFVVVRLSIDNTGERKVPLEQAAFQFRTDERTHDFQPLVEHQGFLDFPISPGQHYVGWTVFTVPEGTTGTLVYDQNATDVTVAVEFEHDPDLPAEVSQQ